MIEFVDQSEATRQMGRDDFAVGRPYAYGCDIFSRSSRAYANWREGWLDAAGQDGREQTPGEAEYWARFPLDTPAGFYYEIIDRIRAGEDEAVVLADVGLVPCSHTKCFETIERLDQLLINHTAQLVEAQAEIKRLREQLGEPVDYMAEVK